MHSSEGLSLHGDDFTVSVCFPARINMADPPGMLTLSDENTANVPVLLISLGAFVRVCWI
jgi:hypothetical protein